MLTFPAAEVAAFPADQVAVPGRACAAVLELAVAAPTASRAVMAARANHVNRGGRMVPPSVEVPTPRLPLPRLSCKKNDATSCDACDKYAWHAVSSELLAV